MLSRSNFVVPILTLALSAVACADDGDRDQLGSGEPPPALEPAEYTLPPGAVDHGEALADLDAQLLELRALAETKPNSWIMIELVANAEGRRGRLTGSVDDYLAADASLAAAFDRAPAGAGPWLSRAQLDFSLHRFASAGQALDAAAERVLIDDPFLAAIEGLRGELSLQAGALDDAGERTALAEDLHPSATTAAREAQVLWRQGDYAGAEQRYLDGLARYHGLDASVPAWFHLQLGIMELERLEYDAALEHFLDANAELSGYYLVEEHIAEIWALQGRHAEALGLYLDIVERTQNPEFMDAIAGLHLDAGDPDDAEPWIAAAREAYEAQLASQPLLSYGHALGHFLDFGPSARAVELAELNLELRPNGDARAELLRAYLGDARVEDALAQAELLAADDWRTANTLGAIYEAHEAAGTTTSQVAVSARAELCELAPAACPG